MWFQSVSSLMPSLSAYHLTWVSLTLDVGYLFMATPAKHILCPLYVNSELSDVQDGFRKGRETRDQIANIR